MTEFLLNLDSVSKSFRGRRVLRAANLRIQAGEIHALVGRGGSGKTTLLRIAAGCLWPDEGWVYYKGQAHNGSQLSDLSGRGLFFLPDRGFLSPQFSVRHQLQFFVERSPSLNATEAFDTACERTRITTLLRERPSALSPAERRRAEIAAVLLVRPLCLVVDEPFREVAPLDVELFSRVFRELALAGSAVVVSGHELSETLAGVDAVTHCRDGKTTALGTPESARANDEFRRDCLARVKP